MGHTRVGVAVIVVAFVLVQATNAASTAVLTLYVSVGLGLPVFWAGLALAIAARNAVGLTAQPVTPCGACRQVALEVEDRYQQPMRVLLYGTEGVYVVGSMHDLVPLSFSDGAMR